MSCGADAQAKLWPLAFDLIDKNDVDGGSAFERTRVNPLQVYSGDEAFNAIDHQYGTECFATVSSQLQIWDINRSHALSTIPWGSETQVAVKWNKAEPNVLASSSSDRMITLYDSRLKTALRKVQLPGKSNSLCWNPREPFHFTAANEDHNLYTFDMRKLKSAYGIHRDFMSSVMSVDYNPNGKEFCAGSYDQTLRIFKVSKGTSREVYHTKRMNRVFSVLFSQDSRYVMSGSDDTNIRLWKAEASKPLQHLHPVEKEKLDYQEKLKKRYGHLSEINRIARHRHVPLSIYNAKKKKKVMLDAAKAKQRRMLLHRKKGSVPIKPAKEAIVGEIKE